MVSTATGVLTTGLGGKTQLLPALDSFDLLVDCPIVHESQRFHLLKEIEV